MRKFNMAVLIALTCASLLLGACSGLETVANIYEEGGEKAVEATAIALNTECRRSMDRRKKFVAAINAKQAENSRTGRAVAQDCDGDGKPDF